MSSVYVVVSTKNEEVVDCEVYAGLQTALARAKSISWQFSSTKAAGTFLWLEHYPKEEKFPDGSIRWIVLEGTHQLVMVIYRPIVASLNDKPIIPQVSVPTYNFHDPELPFGWDSDDKPILTKDMMDNPSYSQDPLRLTEEQKWALIIARVRKSPGYQPNLQSHVFFVDNQAYVLQQLADCTSYGLRVRDDEISLLSELFFDQ